MIFKFNFIVILRPIKYLYLKTAIHTKIGYYMIEKIKVKEIQKPSASQELRGLTFTFNRLVNSKGALQ